MDGQNTNKEYQRNHSSRLFAHIRRPSSVSEIFQREFRCVKPQQLYRKYTGKLRIPTKIEELETMDCNEALESSSKAVSVKKPLATGCVFDEQMNLKFRDIEATLLFDQKRADAKIQQAEDKITRLPNESWQTNQQHLSSYILNPEFHNSTAKNILPVEINKEHSLKNSSKKKYPLIHEDIRIERSLFERIFFCC